MHDVALKKDWTRVTFGEVVKLSGEHSSNPEEDGIERFVGLEHIDARDLKIRRWGDVAAGTTFTSVFRPGQVLFGKRRAYQRKVAVADFSGVCSGDIYVLEPKNAHLLPELLPFICQSDGFFEHAIGTSAGSLSPRTNWDSLASYEFALPPAQEQMRIARALHQFEAVQSHHQRVRQRSENLTVSYLSVALLDGQQVCGHTDETELLSGWSWIKMGEIVADTKAGLFKKKDDYGFGSNIVGVSDLYGHRSIDGQLFASAPASVDEASEFVLKEGDLVYGESSLVRAGIARTLPVTAKGAGTLFAWHTRRVTLDRGRVCPFFVSAYLNSPFGRRDIMSRSTTTVLTGITVADFLAVPIPIGPLESQRRIQADIEAVWQSQTLSETRCVALGQIGHTFGRTSLAAGS